MNQFQDALMWQQYDFILNTVIMQTEQELEMAKQSLESALDSQNGMPKMMGDPLDKSKVTREGGFITLLDIFRERNGFISFVIIQNNLKIFPFPVREKMVAIAITLHAFDSNNEFGEAFELVLSHLAEVSGGITLQQTLLALY